MLNIDLTQYNPVQSDSQYANVPLPSAHLVVIEESEMKESVKDGFTKGTNLLLELTILASSTGNDFVGEKLALYIPYAGFEETALKAGMKRLSTLAYTLGVGGYLQNKEDLHGQNFIVVLEKQKNSNFANFKRILNAQGQEIADASGNFKPCELKDNALQVELDKLLVSLAGQGQTQAQGGNTQQQAQGFGGTPNNQQAQSVPPQNFAPQFGQQQATTTPPQGNFGQAQPQNTAQQPNFGNQQQAQGFGGGNVPQWGQQVNPNNGQA